MFMQRKGTIDPVQLGDVPTGTKKTAADISTKHLQQQSTRPVEGATIGKLGPYGPTRASMLWDFQGCVR